MLVCLSRMMMQSKILENFCSMAPMRRGKTFFKSLMLDNYLENFAKDLTSSLAGEKFSWQSLFNFENAIQINNNFIQLCNKLLNNPITPSPRLTRIFGIPEFRVTRKSR